MKAPKSVVKKPAGSDREETQTSRAQKEPPCQIAGIYRTYAIIHQPGATYSSATSLYTPTMFMEIGSIKGSFVGDVSQVMPKSISIAGSGKIAKSGGSQASIGGLTITQFSGDEHQITNDFILTEIDIGNGQTYSGFVSARVTPLAPGTLVLTEPDLGHGLDNSSGVAIEVGNSLIAVCKETKRGDVICKFTVKNPDGNRKTHIIYTHLMALMPPDDVAKLRKRGLVPSSYSDKTHHLTTLYKMYKALE
jgi:hypothetical protein